MTELSFTLPCLSSRMEAEKLRPSRSSGLPVRVLRGVMPARRFANSLVLESPCEFTYAAATNGQPADLGTISYHPITVDSAEIYLQQRLVAAVANIQKTLQQQQTNQKT